MRMLSAVGLLPAVAFVGAGAETPRVGGTWMFHHEGVLGTSLGVTVRAADAEAAECAEAAALAMFDRDEAALSAWRVDSEFSRWSRTRMEPVKVSPELMETLAAFDAWREKTDGALDSSVEAATRLWKRATAEGRVPTDAEIRETREAMAQQHWVLDRANGTAMRLTDVPLALATFAKSRITQRAAEAAMAAGASGVMLNVGGDVVVRGALTQVVAVADPQHAADNDSPMDLVVVKDAAVATSGGYKRGFEIASAVGKAPEYSHLIDPRTAMPVGRVLQSTVIAKDAETAGALATAFAVMPVEQSRALAAKSPGVEYTLVMADGETVQSAGWAKYGMRSSAASVRPVAYSAPVKAAAGMWDPAFELMVDVTLPRIDDARYRRPYVAVWIEDENHFPVRTLALWTQKPRWLPELKQWYREDQVRNMAEGSDISATVGSATRPAGKYSLKWDGKDNEGKPVKAGTYTVVVEASREHGGYEIERHALNFDGKPAQAAMQGNKELGAIALDYRKK